MKSVYGKRLLSAINPAGFIAVPAGVLWGSFL